MVNNYLKDCLLWNLNCSSKLHPLDRLGSGVKLLGLSEKALGVELFTWSSKFTPGVTYYINSCQFVSSFSKSASWLPIDHPDDRIR